MVSPRKSRKKSVCFSRTVTGMPARASSRPSIIPAGPPPMMQAVVVRDGVGGGGHGGLRIPQDVRFREAQSRRGTRYLVGCVAILTTDFAVGKI